jgi:Asp-tRNA(Asn)/Glu-tRNA(Gln) amidotransferase A subunit family amidase
MPQGAGRRVAATIGIAGLAATLAAALPPAPTVAAPAAANPLLAPYYTELDLTGDAQVARDDLAVVAALLGSAPADPGWNEAADVDGDSAVTVADLAAVAQRMVYDDGPFDLVEASVIEMQAAMNAGVATSVEITQAYLDRIAAYDRALVDTAAGGRPLNSIVTVSAAALDAAAAADAVRAEHGMTSLVLGVPIILKDNYDTADMPTTAGCGCWDDNQTTTDATMVAGLRGAGAVILAKASMDEFAYGFVSEFSAGLPAGQSLLVASPYNTARSAGGSSGGTGAAIAANLGGIGFGTDTGGSIRVPASYNQVVGVRPTIGLASRDGIVPLALSQDTGGPIARSVLDAAAALDAVVGVDAADPVTAGQVGKVPASYTAYLDPGALDGARIGFVPAMIGSNATNQRLWQETKAALEAAGASVVEVAAPAGFDAVLGEPSGSTNEFRHDLELYVQNHLAEAVAARTLGEILDSGRYVPSRQSTYLARAAITEEQYEAWAGESGSHTLQLAAGKALVTALLDDLGLDALVYPSGTPYGTHATNLRLSPNTGLPAVSVPMGQAIEADSTIPGANVNLELLGRAYDEGPLLGLAYALEQTLQARTSPVLYGPLG